MSAHLELPGNEPVLDYAPGSAERARLAQEIEAQSRTPRTVPLVIGGERVETETRDPIRAPHRHALLLGEHALAGDAQVDLAIEAALSARTSWGEKSFAERASVFLKAADLLSGPFRQRLNAATLLNQSKTPREAEIDAACELIDFFRFNVHFAARLEAEPLISPPGTLNRFDLRPLDGFVVAVTPFNFTSIAGNLPTAPALMGNTVIWKPSPHATLSAHLILELLMEAGLPPGVINLLYGDAEWLTDRLLGHPRFAGLHFTGSTAVFRALWAKVGARLERYTSYPRLVGECGGKDFVVAHPSAELAALGVAILRGGFEYQGQKCSAVSRVYVPRSLWPGLRAWLREAMAAIVVGDPADFSCFMGAVISRSAHTRIQGYLDLARSDPAASIVSGGKADDQEGFFVWPTLIEVDDPRHPLMSEEIFGPLVSVFVYDDDRFDSVLELCDETSGYALTGAVFARDEHAIQTATRRLRFSAGNFYVNDKPTGAVVGQQPFGGARWSGTNDKAGSLFNVLRWLSPRVIKENHKPPTDWRYPFLG